MSGQDQQRKNDLRSQVEATRADVERQLAGARAQFDQVNDRITARTGRNLVFAVGIGLLFGLVFLFSVIFVTYVFMGLAALIAAFAAVELATALRASGRDVPRIPTVVAAAAVAPAAYFFGAEGSWLVFLAGGALVVLWRLGEQLVPSWRRSAGDILRDINVSMLIQAYIALLMSFAVLLASPQNPDGQWWTLAMVITVVAADTGAYAGGLSFGRHPMAPTISPKKTWEGFAASGLAAVLAGILLSVFMLHAPWWFGIVFGVVLLITGTLGDLAESLIKRDIGVKDMSGWLPGHGGLLDRLDSLLPSAAGAYALYLVFQPLFS